MTTATETIELAKQIGRSPRGDVTVAVRCSAGHPCVITTYPLQREGDRLIPFPTLYWLTCPSLRAAVSRIERGGAIAELRREIAADADFAEMVRRDHAEYAALRWAMLTDDDRTAATRDPSMHRRLRTIGIGGAADHTAVKCLHMHVAHALAASNTIGTRLIELHGLCLCGRDKV